MPVMLRGGPQVTARALHGVTVCMSILQCYSHRLMGTKSVGVKGIST